MAAAELNVTVTHSSEKHDLHVTAQQDRTEPVVQDLARAVEEATGVPLTFQKLIFKGKSLKEMEMPLSALGIQNGCRVMLIGEKSNPEEEVELKKLKNLEKSVEKIANHLEELSKELAGIQQGFLAKDLQAEALCKLDRRVKATIEQFMKILEEIDTMGSTLDSGFSGRWGCVIKKKQQCFPWYMIWPGHSITGNSERTKCVTNHLKILPENFKDSRLKRKGLVKKVQAFLAECDTVEENICQETERLQSTNLALAE
ncbi:BAG family molecular chaperone regulator 1 isoform X1 [Cavia porcellus]|uniref:BAG family molecular chaperone regulator 1 isoform X1 n=1 Tax=Cavia porcellus TaxID=10141 RepID=UPI0003513DD2|nr:BAG family molecular chaperone regulator 1 [Cavia porcellus]XP_023421256.1 BAG family molecular chaperone regulator 1 [Cavia porcellus]XP_023421257.1 BAG family molecular chaperone regulator 1 [Cavia porcellus]